MDNSSLWKRLQTDVIAGNFKSIARCISLVENEAAGYENFLQLLPSSPSPIIGITGPPGAGKSTMTDGLINLFVRDNKRVAILCIDPSSAFHSGAVLGDRIRMNEWYNNSNVYIRSLATRGSLGGLNPKIIEITDILGAGRFDYIIIETVGVGQSEIEIAGLADVTVVMLVPEGGDEIQTMKSGLMEVADIFVVNKADRPGADSFVKNLKSMLPAKAGVHSKKIPVLKTVASKKEGVAELAVAIEENLMQQKNPENKNNLLAEKAFYLIQQKRMKNITRQELKRQIIAEGTGFNLYSFIRNY